MVDENKKLFEFEILTCMILLKIIYKKTERQQQKVSLVHLY